ncbi:MAG: GGDEF domain-containing protein [Gemmatimonadetes bacterium]|nr:GGDEF domain-containing protein [Gemmatimonadota bacterium]
MPHTSPDSNAHTLRQLEALAALAEIGPEQTERDIIQVGADVAQRATDSQVAYLHFLNEDEETIELGTWSHDTLTHCSAVHDRHYPVSAAGIWADTVRLRRPVSHNEYASVVGRRGLPTGHSPLSRHLGVPIEHDGRIRLLFGVGNKVAPYDEDDVRTLEVVGRRLWSLLLGRREVERLLDLERRFEHVKSLAAVCAWEYDPSEDRMICDGAFATMFETPHVGDVPRTLAQFLQFVDARDHARVQNALRRDLVGTRVGLRIGGVRATGGSFIAELKWEVRPRELGDEVVVVGMLQDLTERLRLEVLRHDAETDVLTGLPNRRRLRSLLKDGQVERRNASDGYAFHYIDLDHFKPVNDTHGHAAGDEVLQVIARRLQGLVRRDDIVVRLGGDEFAIVQSGIAGAAGAETLAARVIDLASQPITIGAHTVRVGASIGIAVCVGGSTPLVHALQVADRALYRAKGAGGGCFELTHVDEAAPNGQEPAGVPA